MHDHSRFCSVPRQAVRHPVRRGNYREFPAFAFHYRDFGFDILNLTLSGLDPARPFLLQFWAHDHDANGGDTESFVDVTSGRNTLLGGISNTQDVAPASFDDYSLTAIVRSSPSGEIAIDIETVDYADGLLNGFALTQIPEPGASLLLLAGIACLPIRRHS